MKRLEEMAVQENCLGGTMEPSEEELKIFQFFEDIEKRLLESGKNSVEVIEDSDEIVRYCRMDWPDRSRSFFRSDQATVIQDDHGSAVKVVTIFKSIR